MADPIRVATTWHGRIPTRAYRKVESAWVIREHQLQVAIRIIEKEKLTVWWEPDWRMGQVLARRFTNCFVYSIPEESYTETLFKAPGWRPKRDFGRI